MNSSSRTRRFSEFSKVIENWTGVYPAERLLIVSQEAAFADPVREFERVLRHIDVAIGVRPRGNEARDAQHRKQRTGRADAG